MREFRCLVFFPRWTVKSIWKYNSNINIFIHYAFIRLYNGQKNSKNFDYFLGKFIRIFTLHLESCYCSLTTHPNLADWPHLNKSNKMPNEMITLQLGQCGNQSKSNLILFSFVNKIIRFFQWFCLIFSWIWVLEAFMFGAWYFAKWNAWRFCNRWWTWSKGCIFLSSRWWPLHSKISAIGFGTACYSLNYDLSICKGRLASLILRQC